MAQSKKPKMRSQFWSKRAAWRLLPQQDQRGWVKLCGAIVIQADERAGEDFLVGSSGAPIPRGSH